MRKLEVDLRESQDEYLRLRREYDNTVSEFYHTETRLNDHIVHADEEIRRLKSEITTHFDRYNKERLRNESLSSEILVKEGLIN